MKTPWRTSEHARNTEKKKEKTQKHEHTVNKQKHKRAHLNDETQMEGNDKVGTQNGHTRHHSYSQKIKT